MKEIAGRISVFCVSVALIGTFLIGPTAYAQTATSTATVDVSTREAELEAQLTQVLQQISDQQQVLTQEQAKAESIQGDINILKDKINEAQLEIQAHQLAIEALGKDINQKDTTIETLDDQIEQNRDSLAELVRQTNEMDGFSLIDVVLSDKDLSDFFVDDDDYDTLREDMIGTLGVIQQSESDTEVAKQTLTTQKLQEIDEQISVESEQQAIEADEGQENQLLALSKEKQATYQSVINQKEAQADAIRDALFSLRDTAAIPFGEALQYAEEAQQTTGVPPAFLLAILTQESDLGENVGSCYLKNTTTGAGVKVTTGAATAKVMNPTRDVPPFLQITSALNMDPLGTKVSCPIGGVGWGGAMGPAQFIASTWALFEVRIAAATGDTTPDPWDPKDAFTASALYLGDLGAGGGSYSDEENAACRYYSGQACDGSNTTYGASVMEKMESIQTTMIDPLQGT